MVSICERSLRRNSGFLAITIPEEITLPFAWFPFPEDGYANEDLAIQSQHCINLPSCNCKSNCTECHAKYLTAGRWSNRHFPLCFILIVNHGYCKIFIDRKSVRRATARETAATGNPRKIQDIEGHPLQIHERTKLISSIAKFRGGSGPGVITILCVHLAPGYSRSNH